MDTNDQLQDTENYTSNRLRKQGDSHFYSPSTSARCALGQNLNQPSATSTSQLPFNMNNSNSNYGIGNNTNGERRANFSMLDGGHMNDHRSATTTSAYFNKMGANNASKPGDVKKIVIKNFKGKLRKTKFISMLINNNNYFFFNIHSETYTAGQLFGTYM